MRVVFCLVLLASLAVAQAHSQSEPAAQLAAGEAALAAEDWDRALESFRRALATDAGSIDARIGVARALAGGGSPVSAATELARAAAARVDIGRYADAARMLEVAAELAPDDVLILAALGRTLVLDRRYLAAEAPLERAFESGAAGPDSGLYYAAALWENGKLERAEAVLERVVEATGGAFPASYQLGRLLLWQSRYDEAAVLLERCAALAPDAVDVRLDLGRALDGAGEPAAAVAAYREAVALAPEHSELRYGLAMALMRSGDRAAAKSELARYRELYEAEQARTRDEGLAAARVARGRELLERGDIDAAIEHLRDLPESADSLEALAAALRARGDLEGAVTALARAVSLDGERADLRAQLNETRLELLRQ